MDSPARKTDYTALQEEVEIKRQELHSSLLKIQTLTANIQHLEAENSELIHELDQLKKHKCDHSQDHVQNDRVHRQEISDLKKCLEEAEQFGKSSQEDVKRLEQQMKFKSATPNREVTLDDDDDDDEIMIQQLKISELEDEKNSLSAKVMDLTMALQEKEYEVANLQQEMDEKDMEIECAERNFSTQCSITENLREEIQDLRTQLESEKGQVNTNRKGNSLFSEVEDRRVAAEKKVVKMDSVLSDAQKKLAKEIEENKRLKQQILLLRQTASKTHNDEVVRTLQRQLEESKKSVITLNEQLQKKETSAKPRSEIPTHSMTNTTDEDKDFIKFLQGMITRKKKEVEEAKAEARRSHMQMLRTDLRLTETRNEVISVSHDRDQLKMKYSTLVFTIQELQRKYEPERFAPPSKEKVKIPQLENNTAKFCSQNNQRRSTLEPLTGQEKVTTEEIKNPVSSKTAFGDDLKENKSDKSVRMRQEVDVISSSGDQDMADLKSDGKGGKMKRSGKGTGKYRSVTYQTVETQPSDCKQQ